MRSTIAGYFLLASLIGAGAAGAADCPAGALGVSRTIVVDPSEHSLLGSMQYGETLPLKDREVVLTFDDGPLPPYTNRILETLASECVKATFFLVGRMVRGYPAIVRRIHAEGHTIANHSQNHPFTFHKMTVDQAAQEIEDGLASLRNALDNPQAISPFFRIPGLLRQPSVEQYLTSRGYMTWSVDFAADDWTRISSQEVARRAISRLEARGRGILLLHDIQPATALAFPEILQEIKARGFKIVHVVPATAGRPKTVTDPQQWAVRRAAPERQVWPRTLVAGEGPAPVLSAPMPASFGIEDLGPPRGLKLAMATSFARPPLREDGLPVRPSAPWPRVAAYPVPSHADVLPAPSAAHFRYSRPVRLAGAVRPKPPAPKKPAGEAPAMRPAIGSIFSFLPGSPRVVGHQLTVARPPNSLTQAR